MRCTAGSRPCDCLAAQSALRPEASWCGREDLRRNRVEYPLLRPHKITPECHPAGPGMIFQTGIATGLVENTPIVTKASCT